MASSDSSQRNGMFQRCMKTTHILFPCDTKTDVCLCEQGIWLIPCFGIDPTINGSTLEVATKSHCDATGPKAVQLYDRAIADKELSKNGTSQFVGPPSQNETLVLGATTTVHIQTNSLSAATPEPVTSTQNVTIVAHILGASSFSQLVDVAPLPKSTTPAMSSGAATPTDDASHPSSSSPPASVIAGSVIGSVIVFAIIIVLALVYFRRQKVSNTTKTTESNEMPEEVKAQEISTGRNFGRVEASADSNTWELSNHARYEADGGQVPVSGGPWELPGHVETGYDTKKG